MKPLRTRSNDSLETQAKKGAARRFFTSMPVLVVLGAGIFSSPTILDMVQHHRWEKKVSSSVGTVMSEKPDDERTMDVLSRLSFGRRNAEDLLTKLDAIAKTGGLRGFEPEAAHSGLWILMQGYEANGNNELNHALCGISTWTSFSGHAPTSSAQFSQMKIADLYDSGKLDGLLAMGRKSGGSK